MFFLQKRKYLAETANSGAGADREDDIDTNDCPAVGKYKNWYNDSSHLHLLPRLSPNSN